MESLIHLDCLLVLIWGVAIAGIGWEALDWNWPAKEKLKYNFLPETQELNCKALPIVKVIAVLV